MKKQLLSEYEKPGILHYEILFMSWAGWVFDFYDLIVFTFFSSQSEMNFIFPISSFPIFSARRLRLPPSEG
jgi:hypothetical protein